MKTYSELIKLKTFKDRFNYLLIGNGVAEETFGFRRYLNQEFYRSKEWKAFRRDMIIRDNGCEMGLEPYEITGLIFVHHIEPVTVDDIINKNFDVLLNPENSVCVSSRLHNAIHYGDLTVLEPAFHIRYKGDTKLW